MDHWSSVRNVESASHVDLPRSDESDEPVEEVETSRLGARQWAQWKIDIVHYYFNK